MTTEIEKTFFDTLGIEPKLNSPCEHLLQNKYCSEDKICRDTYFEPFPYCVGFENCTKEYKTRVWFYPQISDRILLELICIANEAYIDLEGTDIETMKNSLLENFIFFRRDVYDQVRTLFEEG